MDTGKIKRIKDGGVILPAGLLVFVAAFNLFVMYKFFPITDGWFQDAASYMNSGSVMYRDFHMYIPPAYPALIAVLYNFFGKTMIYYRLFGVAERVFLVLLTWFVLRRVFKPAPTFVALMISSVVYVLNLQDVFYGYYQMSIVAAMLMLLAGIRVYEAVTSGADTKKTVIRAVLFGLSICWATLVKHTIGVILGFAITVVLILVLLVSNRRAIIKIIASEAVAFIVPISAFAIYMSAIGALSPMLKDLFGGDSSKGSYATVLFGFFPKITTAFSIFLAGMILLFIFAYKKHTRLKQVGWAAEDISLVALSIMAGVWWLKYLTDDIIAEWPWYFTTLFFIVIVAQIFEAYVISASIDNGLLRLLPFTVHCGGTLLMFIFMTRCPVSFGNWMILRDSRQYLYFAVFFVLIIYSVYLLVTHLTKRRDCGKELMVCVMSWGIMYVHGMSNTIEDHAMLLSLAYVFALLLSAEGTRKTARNTLILFIGFLLVFSGCYQKCVKPYHWWICGSMAEVRLSTESFEDPNLKGFRGEPTYVATMNAMYELIQANYQEGDAMYTFPSINYFNLTVDAPNTMFGKVHFFDTCPDSIAISDAKRIEEDMPEIIVFDCPIDEVWEVHEELFRDGNPSGQRQIAKAVMELVENGDYTLVGSYVPGSFGERVYFFVRNDGRTFTYGSDYSKSYTDDFIEYCENLL